MDATRAEAGLGEGEAATLLAEDVGDRDAHILEAQFAVALAVVVPEHQQITHDGESRGVHGDQHHGLLSIGRCVWIGLAHHDGHLAARVGRTADPPLASVEHVLIALTADGQLDVAGIAGGHVGLGHGEAGTDLSRQQRHQPLVLLLGGAEQRQDLHVAGVGCGGVERLGGERAATADLGQRGVVHVGHRLGRPFGHMGEEQVPQSALPGGGLELLHDMGMEVRVARGLHLGGEDRLGRHHLLGHERLEAFDQVSGAWARGEFHVAVLGL